MPSGAVAWGKWKYHVLSAFLYSVAQAYVSNNAPSPPPPVIFNYTNVSAVADDGVNIITQAVVGCRDCPPEFQPPLRQDEPYIAPPNFGAPSPPVMAPGEYPGNNNHLRPVPPPPPSPGPSPIASAAPMSFLKTLRLSSDDDDKECFPGNAEVQVRGRGRVPMTNLQQDDQVLVEDASGRFFEPVLGFLHTAPGTRGRHSGHLSVVHSCGNFRASQGHIVFVADHRGAKLDKFVADLHVGDKLFASTDGVATLCTVLGVRHDANDLGMYAPMTMTGTIIVDGVVASNYATSSVRLPHSCAHAFFSPVRMFHKLGLARVWSSIYSGSVERAASVEETFHPWVTVRRIVPVERLQKSLATWF